MLATLTILFLSTAHADENEKSPKIVYKSETTIDFEALDIEGQLVKPLGDIITERQKAAFNPLIKLRTDFNPEMRNSVNEIKVIRS